MEGVGSADIDDSYPPSSQMCLSIGDSNPPEGAGSAYTQQEEGHQGDSSSALSQQAAPQQSQCYTPGWSPPPSEAPSAESGDDSPTDLNQSTPDLNQSLDLNQSFDLNKFKNTNFDAIVDYTLNAPEDEPLSSLESSQSDVEDTGDHTLYPSRGTLDISRAKDLLGYQPKHDLKKGLESYYEWIRHYSGKV